MSVGEEKCVGRKSGGYFKEGRRRMEERLGGDEGGDGGRRQASFEILFYSLS
jgi:hypothetical protein